MSQTRAHHFAIEDLVVFRIAEDGLSIQQRLLEEQIGPGPYMITDVVSAPESFSTPSATQPRRLIISPPHSQNVCVASDGYPHYAASDWLSGALFTRANKD